MDLSEEQIKELSHQVVDNLIERLTEMADKQNIPLDGLVSLLFQIFTKKEG